MKYKAFSKRLIAKLEAQLPELEWSTDIIEVKGKDTLIVEAYSKEKDLGIGISLGNKPTTQDIGKLVDTLLAQGLTLIEDDLITQVVQEEMRRG